MEESMIRVIAPATLQEGYAFDVLVDDEPFTVIVPAGGVNEGEEFFVPYGCDEQGDHEHGHGRHHDEPSTLGEDRHHQHHQHHQHGGSNKARCKMSRGDKYDQDRDDGHGHDHENDSDSADGMTAPLPSSSEDTEDMFDELGAPLRRWRTALCSCCDVYTQSTFWMALCCAPVLVAQLTHRLGLTWKGLVGSKEEASLAFNRLVIGEIITLALSKIPGIGILLLFGYQVFATIWVGANVRRFVRRKYKIPASLPKTCGWDRIDDCCCMVFCGCCSTIQIARHTHDDKEFPGHGCTTSGLGMDAPSIV